MIKTDTMEIKETANLFKQCELLGVHKIKATFMVNPNVPNPVKLSKMEKELHLDKFAERLVTSKNMIPTLKRCGRKVECKSKIYKVKKKAVQGIEFCVEWGNKNETTI